MSKAEISNLLAQQRQYFQSGTTRPIAFRQTQLATLQRAVKENESAIIKALHADLNKSAFEGYLTEIGTTLEEIGYQLKHLPRLARPQKVRTPLTLFRGHSEIRPEPYGNVLNIAPWNYPFYLSIAPLAGAMAAGNTMILKPSEHAFHTSKLLAEILPRYFQTPYLAVIEGGIDTNEALLAEKFDYIFFTGSISVGKIVMAAAAEHLTPVTLELGGKSPCIVDESADLVQAAKSIMWGKCINAGQTCVAPDYLLVQKNVKLSLLAEIKRQIEAFYGKRPLQHPDYPKIISKRHYGRLKAFLQQGEILCGGGFNDETGKIEPTLLDGIGWENPVMQEEIFGPILPVLSFSDLSDAIGQIQARPKPLALYAFTRSAANERRLLAEISFGGGCINDTLVHLANSALPFGGVGASGMGSYHGQKSFETFSHYKSVFKRSAWPDIPLRYPPFTPQKLAWLKKLLR
ncbi:MAG: aldehyde dehydrogenase [Neisseria sp.]|nr:aldehyde dehydrogenase [Neisseria sp.]